MSEALPRGYTRPLSLQAFDKHYWMTQDDPLERIAQRLDEIPKVSLLTERMIAGLTLVDERSCQAGLVGANAAGLYQP